MLCRRQRREQRQGGNRHVGLEADKFQSVLHAPVAGFKPRIDQNDIHALRPPNDTARAVDAPDRRERQSVMSAVKRKSQADMANS